MASGTGLVVPVDVVAFCVSATDEQLATGLFAGATVDYSNQTSSTTPAYLGNNVNRGFAAEPLKRLEAGVHIHWAIPDALTRGGVDESNTTLQFPAVPNRWLVTRFVVDGATPGAPRSWVVESDALVSTAPFSQWPTIPVSTAGAGADFNYLGQSIDLASYAPAQLLSGPRTFKSTAGAELSVVSNGVPSFAAFYPESRSAFGFVDTLADVSGSANLMYVVTGWYDEPGNDPATLSTTLATTHQWSGSDGPPAYTLYSGLVQDVAWNPAQVYVPLQQGAGGQAQLPPITAAATIGNTPTEALSAYFRQLNHPSVPFFEQLLNGFQQGLLKQFSQPTPDQLPKLAEALHDNQFQAANSGTIYTIAQTLADGTEVEVIDLPLPLADALNELNVAAQQYEEVSTSVESFQWRMFADWYRYYQTDPSQNSIIYNHASSTLLPQWGDATSGLQGALNTADTALQSQLSTVQGMLGPDLYLKPTQAPRYWQPTEPAVLLASDDLAFPVRHGGDNSYSDDGTLVCRPTDQLITSVAVGSTSINAGAFSAICQLPSSSLPYAPDCSNLLIEACLLNTQIAAFRSGQTDTALTTALEALLDGDSQITWTISAGTAPSPVAINWWGPGNPWLPLFLQWTIDFVPLQPTLTGPNGTTLTNYDPQFFTANYTIDPGTGSFVSYTPNGSSHSINLDPATATYTPTYSGQSILSAAAALNLAQTIVDYTAKTPDQTLQTILDQLQSTATLVQAMSGFTDALLMRQQIVQLTIAVPPGASITSSTLTSETQSVVGNSYSVGPQLGASTQTYNPIRAGYFEVSLQAVDAFGQKRAISLSSIAVAESMTALSGGNPAPNIAYAAPRLAQAARLLFQWISADAVDIAEMNSHPATAPVCGWLLPNHLDGGFFLYDGAGRPLGTLQLNGDDSAVVWQSAPGDDATINQPITQALADVNPVMRDLAVSLKNATPSYFLSFWKAVDQVHGSINPQMLATNAGLSVLIGRPVAVAQIALRLDLRGRPSLNQTWGCLSNNAWIDTENGFTGVQFPVVLGDIDKLDDGLIGYFKQSGTGYDLTTFYTEGAALGASAGVVLPTQTTLLLTPTPTLDDPEPPPVATETTRVLVLVDPRAKVHATMGVLPTQYLQIPPDVAADALSTLEMSFLTTPVLQPASGLAIPVPRENGYAVSWVEEDKDQSNQPEWVTVPDIAAPNSNAVWDYTPQRVTEGWLRLNPTLLTFDLLNSQGQSLAVGGTAQAMTLRVANRKPGTVTFTPGQIQAEGQPANGSIVYLHFGALVATADVAAIGLSAAGWTFAPQSDQRYGQYWAATPTAAVPLAAGASFDIAVTNLKAVTSAVQAQVYVDYYAVDGASDGVFADLVTIQQ